MVNLAIAICDVCCVYIYIYIYIYIYMCAVDHEEYTCMMSLLSS